MLAFYLASSQALRCAFSQSQMKQVLNADQHFLLAPTPRITLLTFWRGTFLFDVSLATNREYSALSYTDLSLLVAIPLLITICSFK